jgi:hypothetical protein
MAVLCGFDRAIVCRVLSNFQSVMDGSNPDNRAAMYVFQVEAAMERVRDMKTKLAYVKELDLMPLWKSVCEYNLGYCPERTSK